MADHMLCIRTPDAILSDFDAGTRGVEDVDMREILWQIINTVCDSYALALRGVGREGAVLSDTPGVVPDQPRIKAGGNPLTRGQIVEIEETVSDFLVNNFGDD